MLNPLNHFEVPVNHTGLSSISILNLRLHNHEQFDYVNHKFSSMKYYYISSYNPNPTYSLIHQFDLN